MPCTEGQRQEPLSIPDSPRLHNTVFRRGKNKSLHLKNNLSGSSPEIALPWAHNASKMSVLLYVVSHMIGPTGI